MEIYTAKELKELPTLNSGHFDNLKIETEDIRVWLSRMTIEDGQPYNNMITVEHLVKGVWKIVTEYEG